MAGTLLLFDVDGTLVGRASREHAAALREALRDVHGVPLDFQAEIDAAGRTDGEIARLLLTAAGVDATRIDDGVARVREAAVAAYARLCPPDLSDLVLPGIAELLPELSRREDVRLGLLTGNFEPIARLKLGRAGIGAAFPTGEGGFGSDAEDRAALPAIARRRAGNGPAGAARAGDGHAGGGSDGGKPAADGSDGDGRTGGGSPWPRAATIVIGDTPRDIACARADDVRCVAVATGNYAADALGAADAVAGPGDLRAVLLPLLAAASDGG